MTTLEATVQIVAAKMTNNAHGAYRASGVEVAEFFEEIYKKIQELENQNR